MSIDDRLRKHLAEAKSGDGMARLSAMLAETRAMLVALHADQERIDRKIAELRAAKAEQPRDGVTDLIETQERETAEMLRRMTVRDEEKAKD